METQNQRGRYSCVLSGLFKGLWISQTKGKNLIDRRVSNLSVDLSLREIGN